MKNRSGRLLLTLLLSWCLSSATASAGPTNFTFGFVIGSNVGSGFLTAEDQGNGSFWATSGAMIVTGGVAVGTYVLAAGGPGGTSSPSGQFVFDNLLFPSQDPVFDVAGLLFLGSGLEINLLGITGSPGVYGFLVKNPDGLHVDIISATVDLNAVPEPSTIALLLMGGAGIWFARRRDRSRIVR